MAHPRLASARLLLFVAAPEGVLNAGVPVSFFTSHLMKRRSKMRLITDSELANRTDLELAILFQIASEALARTTPGSPERQTVIASLQNIGRARSARHRQCRTPGL
jgi:hypothetical protein